MQWSKWMWNRKQWKRIVADEKNRQILHLIVEDGHWYLSDARRQISIDHGVTRGFTSNKFAKIRVDIKARKWLKTNNFT